MMKKNRSTNHGAAIVIVFLTVVENRSMIATTSATVASTDLFAPKTFVISRIANVTTNTRRNGKIKEKFSRSISPSNGVAIYFPLKKSPISLKSLNPSFSALSSFVMRLFSLEIFSIMR